jgi:hypothetical protein
MHLRKQLAAIFSPTRRLAGPEPVTVRAGGLLGELQWVVPRAECEYHRHDFSMLPARQRAAAAAIAARRHAGGDARHHVAWKGAIAHVWSWRGGDAPLAADAGWIPESLLRRAPSADGLRLLAQVRGFEGQCWRDGDLQSSQWWADAPSAAAWQRFARASGLGPDAAALPEAEALPWSEPWADAKRGMPASPAMLERIAWRAIACAILAALGWQVAGTLQLHLAQASLDAKMNALRAKAAPLLAAREQAERAQDGLAALRALQQGHDDYRLVSRVIQPLPADTRVLEWHREGDKLQVAVQSGDADPRHFVSAYAGDKLLSGVVATPGNSGTTMLAFDFSPPAVQP